MKKFWAAASAALLAAGILFSACAKKIPEPASNPDSRLTEPESAAWEDIISEPEPVSEPVSEPASEHESRPESKPEAESEQSWENAAETPPQSSRHEAPPPAPEPEAPIQSAPERLNAVAPDTALDHKLIERELFRLINELRQSEGAEALGLHDEMVFAARIRSAEALQSFSHTRPNGSTYNTAFDEAGFSYAGKWHGENLASLNFTDGMMDEKAAALEMFTGLRNSPGHYQNMMGENFLQAGIGVAVILDGDMIRIASAQLFASL